MKDQTNSIRVGEPKISTSLFFKGAIVCTVMFIEVLKGIFKWISNIKVYRVNFNYTNVWSPLKHSIHLTHKLDQVYEWMQIQPLLSSKANYHTTICNINIL